MPKGNLKTQTKTSKSIGNTALNQLYKRLADLLKIKSIVTLISAATFSYLATTGKMDVKDSMVLISMVFTYLFNKSTIERKDE